MRRHLERHLVSRIGWLRAAIMGANDGIVSTGSLLVGVAAAGSARHEILLAGVAGLVAGAMSMAAGEYVSVSSQSDTEHADLARERSELDANPEAEHRELANIYLERGLSPETADEVAGQMMAKDPLFAHARDELGMSEITSARPIQAALTSAATFSVGAIAPLSAAVLSPLVPLVWIIAFCSLASLATLGAVGALAGGAKVWRGTARVAFWGALAMAVTAGIGRLIGAVGF